MVAAGGALQVVAGILRRGNTILACRRALDTSLGGKWELPGGKIRGGESPPQALVRELSEELGITARPGPEVHRVRHTYPGGPPVEIRFFEIESFEPEPVNRAFEEIRWAAPSELTGLDWLEADLPLVERLEAAGGSALAPAGRA